MTDHALALDVRDIAKRYGSTVALDGVSFSVAAGETHALLGENGAGKSTLVRILSGLTRPDAGRIALFGSDIGFSGARDARRAGVRTAFQEISLVRDLTVAQNFLLMEEPLGPFGLISRRAGEAAVAEELARLGLPGVSPRDVVADLDLPTRQKIEIARCISRKPKLLLLDEPTASLSMRDVEWLAGLLATLKAEGVTVIFISHRMQEVREFCDSMTVLRNGRSIGSSRVADLGDDQVIAMMIGRSLDIVFPPKEDRTRPETALSVRGVGTGSAVSDLSFDLRRGQIMGVGGLQGMGQRELFLALFGAARLSAGEIAVDGKVVDLGAPADAVAAGIGLVPEDRKTEGLFLPFTGTDNIALPSLDRTTGYGLVDRRREMQAVSGFLAQVKIAPDALTRPAEQFSGGNQQKMVIAKWLMTGCHVLLLYDPTRGVDIGTKAEIYRLIADFAASGGAVLLYSTDIGELVGLCGEVLVMYRGRIGEVLRGDMVDEDHILRAALGQASAVAA